MATGGNMGDLWFQLGIKDNTSKTLQEIINKLSRGESAANDMVRALHRWGEGKDFKSQADGAGKFLDVLNQINSKLVKLKDNGKDEQYGSLKTALKNALDYLGLLQKINIERGKIAELKALSPNVDTSKLEKADAMLANIKTQLLALEGQQNIDKAEVLQGYGKSLQNTLRDVKAITSEFKKENPFSSFSNNTAKVEADLARVGEKYAMLRDLMREGAMKGYDTTMLKEAANELNNILSVLNSAKGNKSLLTDATQMKNIFSDVAVSMTKATVATHAYGREKGKVIAQDREDKRLASNVRQMSNLYDDLLHKLSRAEQVGMKSLALGVDTSNLDKAISALRAFAEQVDKPPKALMGKGGRREYADFASEAMKLKRALDETVLSQRALNAAQEKQNKKVASDKQREEAKAAREAASAEKQRQKEIDHTILRYDSLGDKVRALRREYSRGIALGVDVSKAEEGIRRLLSIMRVLRSMYLNLAGPGWENHVGQLGNLGTGHDKTLANRSLEDQRALNAAQEKLNREKRKTVDLEGKHRNEVSATAAKVRSDLVSAFEQAKKASSGVGSTLGDIKNLLLQGGIVYGAQNFLRSIIETGGQLEQQHIALQSILGDMQNANQLFGQIKELALNSPFTFSELNKDVKQLAAYGVEYNDLYDTTKRLADMASGLGVSFERIALAFGQVQARGWLDGKELRQIAYAGIPLLDKLSEYYSKREGRDVSKSEVKTRISARGVDFEDVKNIFWEMTDAGGQFYNMQLVLSETLLGKWNKLKDAWEIMLSDFASGRNIVGKTLKGITGLVTNLVIGFHSLAPVVAAVFAGPLLRMMGNKIGGGLDKALLAAKGQLAADYTRRALEGQKLNSVERDILMHKNEITGVDIRNLAAAKALTRAELQRLFVSGKITKQMYLQGMALTRQTAQSKGWGLSGLFGGWGKAKVGALGGMVLGGLKSGLMSIVSFFGGLPGMAISAGLAIFSYFEQKNAELKQNMTQTLDELKDRAKQMGEFLEENDASKAIAEGDSKAIDNMINEYKEKMKQIAPYNYNNLVMKADERESHKERLKYLADELELLQQSNKISQEKLSDKGTYKDLKDALMKASDMYDDIDKATADLIAGGADKATARKKAFGMSLFVKTSTENLKKEIKEIFGDISKDRVALEAAKQCMSSLFAQMGISDERANEIRASVLQSFGLTDGWLEGQVGHEMRQMIDNVAPDIAMKIRSGQQLNEAETKKVKELMDDAKRNLTLKYPEFEMTLQRLLAASRFTAVIDLVVNDAGKYGDVQGTMAKRMPKFSLVEKSKRDQYMNYVSTWGKQDSWYEARNAAKSEIDRLKNEYDAAKGSKSSKERLNWLKYQYDNAVGAALDLLNYDYKGEAKKSNKHESAGHKEDLALKRLKERISLYKKLYGELKRFKDLYGEGALAHLEADGEFASIFKDKKGFPLSDYSNYETSIKELLKTLPQTTADRKYFAKSETADIQSENRKLLEDSRKDELSDLSKQLDIIEEQYKTYKKLYELTGNKEGSQRIAFGGVVASDSMLKYLKAMLEVSVAGDNEASGLNFSAEDVAGMDAKTVKEHYGEDSRTYAYRLKLEAERNKLKQESIDLLADMIEKNATISQQIEDENMSYERQKSLLLNIEDPKLRQRAKEGLAKSHQDKLSSLLFEQFKEGSDWVTIFDDLDRVSTNTINTMIADIEKFSKTAGLSVKEVKELRSALEKLRNESIERNPLDALLHSTSRGNAIGSYLKGNGGPQYMHNGKYVLTPEQAKKMGLEAGVDYSKNDLENQQQGAYNDFEKGLSSLSNKFKALQECMSPVIDLFENLGMEDTALGQGSQVIGGALGAATQVAGGLNALGLEKAGPYGAIVGAGLSVVSGLAALHDKALQKEIEASARRQKELENLYKNVESTLNNILGGVYAYGMSEKTQGTLNNIVKDYQKGMSTKGMNGVLLRVLGIESTSHYSKDTYDAAKKSLADPENAYAAERASMLAQRDELMKQRAAEDDKKKKDKDKLADYDQQITEMNEKIHTLAQDFLKDIYSVDMKSWAKELTDAVVGAWEKGEDAMEAYHDKAKDLVKDMTKNIVSQKFMEKALEAPLKYLEGLVAEKGKLDEGDVGQLVTMLMDAGDTAVHNITSVMEALKQKGYDFTEAGSGSVSNSIKSITEDTADLLASYLNAIRADVGVNRANVKAISDVVQMQLPEMGQIQKAQLKQMTMLVSLAEERNGKIDRMLDWMSAVTTSGRKRVYVN